MYTSFTKSDVMFAVVLLDLGEQRPLHVSLIDCQSCRVLYSEDILQPRFVCVRWKLVVRKKDSL